MANKIYNSTWGGKKFYQKIIRTFRRFIGENAYKLVKQGEQAWFKIGGRDQSLPSSSNIKCNMQFKENGEVSVYSSGGDSFRCMTPSDPFIRNSSKKLIRKRNNKTLLCLCLVYYQYYLQDLCNYILTLRCLSIMTKTLSPQKVDLEFYFEFQQSEKT